MRQVWIEQGHVFVLGHQRRLGDDQVAYAAVVHHADRFAGRVVAVFYGLETVGHTAQPQNGPGGYAVQTAGDFAGVRHRRGIGLSEVAEVEQRLCIAIDAVVGAATTVQVKARRVFAFAALISGDGFQKRFKFLWHKFFSLVVRLFVPAGNNYGIYYDAGAGYFVDGFDFCQLAARQACKGQQDD